MFWLYAAHVAAPEATLPIGRSSTDRLVDLSNEPEFVLVVTVIAGLVVGVLLLGAISLAIYLKCRIPRGRSGRKPMSLVASVNSPRPRAGAGSDRPQLNTARSSDFSRRRERA